MKHVIGIILAFASGLISGVSLEFGPKLGLDKEKTLATFLAVFIALVIELAWLQYLDLKETKQLHKEGREAAKGTQETLSRLQGQHERLIEELGQKIEHDEDLQVVLRHQGPGFTLAEMTEKWLYLLNRLRESYWATNFIDSEKIYTTNWARAALLIQNAKKTEVNIFARKVFLIRDELEMLSLSEHIEEQRQIGVEIHHLPYDVFAQDVSLKRQLDSGDIPSIDFGIFDDRIVLVWQLDAARAVTGGSVLYGHEHVEQHKLFFKALFSKAQAFSRDRLTLLRVPPTHLGKLIRIVDAWPLYRGEYAEMNYALRSGHGWLDGFAIKPGCITYAVYAAGTLVGFTLLIGNQKNDAEFYVAVHPLHLRQKLGARLTQATLEVAFREMGLKRVHLKVRTDVQHRIQLYETQGFRHCGRKTELVDGRNVEFLQMEIFSSEFQKKAGGALADDT